MKKALWFIIIGLANVSLYALITWICVDIYFWNAVYASGLAIMIGIPFSFIGHQYLTFEIDGKYIPQFIRFIINHLIGFVVSIVINWIITDILGYPVITSIVVSIILVVSISYLLMNRWVFIQR